MSLWKMVVKISHAALGGTGTNTWHLRSLAPVAEDPAQLNALSAIVHTFYEGACQCVPVGGSCAFDGNFTGVGPNEGFSATGDTWTQPGNSSTDVLPPANAMVVSWEGESGDRSKRGRTFVGPIAVGMLEGDGTPSAACLSNLRGAASGLIASSTGGPNGAIGIWSPQEEVFRDVVGASVQNKFAVLRSRRD